MEGGREEGGGRGRALERLTCWSVKGVWNGVRMNGGREGGGRGEGEGIRETHVLVGEGRLEWRQDEWREGGRREGGGGGH